MATKNETLNQPKISFGGQTICLKNKEFNYLIKLLQHDNSENRDKECFDCACYSRKLLTKVSKLRETVDKRTEESKKLPTTNYGFTFYEKNGYKFSFYFCHKSTFMEVKHENFVSDFIFGIKRHLNDHDNIKVAKKYLLKKFEDYLENFLKKEQYA